MAASVPALAAPLQPTGPWVVDYSDDQCFLDRNYGTDAKPVILAIRRVPLDSDVSVGVYTRGGRSEPAAGKAKVAFGAAAPVVAKFRAYSVPGKGLHNFTTYVRESVPLLDGAAQSGTMTLRAPGEVDDTFLVPALAGGLKALDACVLDLGVSWGVPPEQQSRVKEPPRAVRHDYIGPADYSPQEINQNMNAPSQVRLWVDEAGRPLDCVPLKSNGPQQAFAQTTCRLLLKRAAFTPAIDVGGKPIKSIVVYSVDLLAD